MRLGASAAALVACCSISVMAQQPGAVQAPPDAQTPKTQEPVVTESGTVVLEPVMPEPAAGDALFAPLATGGPDTLHRKFMSYVIVTFGPRALFTPAIGAAIRMARPNPNYPPDWQDGAEAFGRNYGNGVAAKTAFQTARFGVGAAIHEDFRYRPTWTAGVKTNSRRAVPKSDKSVPGRIFYAIGFTFVDRSDSGHDRLAVANFSAAAAGGFVGNAYLPDGFNDVQHGLTRMGTKFGSMAIQNVIREFSPEIFGAAHKLHLPPLHVPVPEWWVPTQYGRQKP